jgi:outer membrane protein OmpA-like peptidoglycan-associated protein
LDNIFGKKSMALSNIVSNVSGLRSSTSNTILNVSGSIIASFLGKKMLSEGLSLNSLIQWLESHKHEIEDLLPAGFTQIKASNNEDASAFNEDTIEEESTKKWMLPLILFGLISIGIWYWVEGCNQENEVHNEIAAEVLDSASASISDAANLAANQVGNKIDEMADTTLGKIDENGNWLAKKGDSIKLKLDNGIEIDAFKNSLEDKFYSFIKDPTATAGKDVWFEFNDLLFNTGKSTLKHSSSTQISNIVEILKAYPDLKIKLGGYTDNVGDSIDNVKLSENRAKAVYNLLLNKGVNKSSFDTKPYEGYGSLHPVAENSTAVGRAQNRRISISVREK